MQKLFTILIVLLLMGTMGSQISADTFIYENGNVREGRVSDINEESLVIRLDIGGFDDRIDLVYLSQETLKMLAENPEYTQFVEPFIELPEEEIHPPQIVVKQPERMEKPEQRGGFMPTLASPVGILLLLALYVGNLFCAVEIARFRQRPVALVCGVSAILPVLGPLLFLLMPSLDHASTYHEDYEEEAHAPVDEAPAPAAAAAPAATGPGTGKSSLGLAKGNASGGSGGGLEGSVFSKDDTTFNRNFFETKFTEFFRVVPSASIRNLVLVFKTVKREYVAKRITRISGSDLHIQLLQGAKEVSVSFGEIVQVEVKNKDAK